MERRRDDHDTPPIFQATLYYHPAEASQLDYLHLDILERPVPRLLEDGRVAVEAVMRLDELTGAVAAGVTVELQRLIDPHFPQELIMSSAEAMAPLRYIAELVRPRDS